MNKVKKFKKVVKWSNNEKDINNLAEFILAFLLVIIFSPILILIFGLRGLKKGIKNMWRDRKVYWREIK